MLVFIFRETTGNFNRYIRYPNWGPAITNETQQCWQEQLALLNWVLATPNMRVPASLLGGTAEALYSWPHHCVHWQVDVIQQPAERYRSERIDNVA
jgi:hypothetical protein